jgi:hypothetical protein
MNNPFGSITAPTTALTSGNPGEALGKLIQLGVDILIVGAGIYALINFVLAGYSFMSAENDPKKMEGAWAKIWQTALGLAIAAGAFVLAAIFGQLIFGNPGAILNPQITPIHP